MIEKKEEPAGPEPMSIRMPVDVRNVALSLLAVLALVLFLQYAQSVLIPIVLGILISYALTPLVNGLARVSVPRALGAAVAVSLLVGVLGVGTYTLKDQMMAVVADVPEAAQRVRVRLRQTRRLPAGPLQQVQRAATEIQKTAEEASPPATRTPTDVQKVQMIEPTLKASDYLWMGGVGLVGFLGQFTVILFLVYFFLVTGDLYKRKLVKIAGPQLTQKKITVQILDDINRQIESFIRVQVVTSFVVGLLTGIALWWLGVQQYIIWGVLAGIFNSIPYLGPVIVTGGLGVVAFMQFDSVPKTISVCGITLLITSLEGFILTPMLLGRAARMNAVAVFVGLLFWSWVWGVWGTILAVPMLMMIKAICDHFEDLQPVGELLGE